jgi:uncharacterized delta-60 repeat protein
VNIAEGPTDTIVAAVGYTVFRYQPDGSLDPSFGEGGELTIADPEGMPFTLHDLAVDTEGRVYLLGNVEVPDVEVQTSYIGGWIHPPLAAVIRYTSEGRLDTTYGGGKGYVITDLGQPSPYGTAVPYKRALTSFATGVVDQDDNLTAISGIGEFPCSLGHSALSTRRKLIVRLGPDGNPDTAFGEGNGVQTIASLDENGPISVTANGEIAFAGSRTDECAETTIYGVGRLGADGSVAPRFGREGVRFLPAPAEAIAVDSFGRVVVLLPGWRVLRLTSSGALDRRFGRKGRAFLHLPGGADPKSLAVESSGGILLAGSRLGPERQNVPGSRRISNAFGVVRITTHGRQDRSFGQGGWVATHFGKQSSALGTDAFQDGNGHLVVGGTVTRPDLAPTGGIALVRYRLTG